MKIYRESKRIIDSQNRQLIAADKQKTSFFQFASHELKSPVIAIKSTLDVVNKGYSGKIEPKAADLLKRAIGRSEQMLKIINELLDLSHSRDIVDKRVVETVDIHEIILSALENEKSNAEEKKIACLKELEAENSSIRINSDDLIKIFSNLIGNAIRYGIEEGKVIVRTTENNNRIFVQVEDNGIGIAKEDLENVFKEFYRSQNAKQVASFGTGLGLSLVKQLVENNSGTIRVESVVGAGTKFTISFPLHRS
jgi:signal transduction histidine kinase